MQADYDHCATLVRERDRERYLATLFALADERPHLFALYAFDLEIAHVSDAVRDPMAGEIRFQWWREALAGERAEEARANPVAAALLDTLKKNAVSAEGLIALIDARQFDLLGQPMESREKLNEYLDATAGRIIELAAEILDSTGKSKEAARNAGRAVGLTRLLRGFAFDVSRGRLFVPLDVLAEHDVHTASVLGGEYSEGLRAALMELRRETEQSLERVRNERIAGQVLPAFLPAALIPLYLARMSKSGYDPFRTDLSISLLRVQFSLWRAARGGAV
jgi:phytoene synthase